MMKTSMMLIVLPASEGLQMFKMFKRGKGGPYELKICFCFEH